MFFSTLLDMDTKKQSCKFFTCVGNHRMCYSRIYFLFFFTFLLLVLHKYLYTVLNVNYKSSYFVTIIPINVYLICFQFDCTRKSIAMYIYLYISYISFYSIYLYLFYISFYSLSIYLLYISNISFMLVILF